MLQSNNKFNTSSIMSHLERHIGKERDLLFLKHKTGRLFTLIELLIVIAIMAILLRSKGPFFLLFSARFAFSPFDKKTLNTQIPNVTFCMIAG